MPYLLEAYDPEFTGFVSLTEMSQPLEPAEEVPRLPGTAVGGDDADDDDAGDDDAGDDAGDDADDDPDGHYEYLSAQLEAYARAHPLRAVGGSGAQVLAFDEFDSEEEEDETHGDETHGGEPDDVGFVNLASIAEDDESAHGLMLLAEGGGDAEGAEGSMEESDDERDDARGIQGLAEDA